MKTRIKLLYSLVYIPIALVSIILFVIFGWNLYSMLTDRPGIWGSLYERYGLKKGIYEAYCFIIAVCSIYFVLSPIYFLIQNDPKRIFKVYKLFLFFFGLVILLEIILSYMFTQKG